MIEPNELEELRRDLMEEDRRLEEYESSMRSDIEFFKKYSSYNDLKDMYTILKLEAQMHNQDIFELIDMIKDE